MSAAATGDASCSAVSPAERQARILLTNLDAPGHPALCGAVSAVGAVAAVELLRAGGLTPMRATVLAERVQAAEDAVAGQLEAAERVGARFVCPGDPEWPEPLYALASAEPRAGVGGMPVGLWVRGPLRLGIGSQRTSQAAGRSAPWVQSVSMVGSRAASDYGLYVAGEIAAGLADASVRVVSGAAYGIDAAAHRGALAVPGGQTVAVLACGVDIAYPKSNEGLLSRIGADGLVVSENPIGSTPTRRRFLIRNRLVAALSVATVIVEATTRSGTTSTAEWAAACSRGVLAVPGPVTSALSAGTHAWIRDLNAGLVTDAADVLRHIQPIGSVPEPTPAPVGSDWRGVISDGAEAVLDAFPARADAGAAQLVTATGLPVGSVLAHLGELDLAGFVQRTDGGWRRTRRGQSISRPDG